ncbi:MAG: hypothetical protein HYX20_01500 [Candidatus Yanofskybacteria bacterium]|nr:hypothetical protein [Candidatus Yanofskybacteria bacterium]
MIVIDYLYWHYVIAPMGILGLLKNYLIGTWHMFLIATHFRTLLAPWHRARPSEFGKSKTFGDKILNTIIDFYIRIIAAIIRLIVILIGLIAELAVVAVFITLLIVWLLWPVILLSLFRKGLWLIFSEPYVRM